MTTDRELLPCPFCGSHKVNLVDNLVIFYVECLRCCAAASPSSDATGAIHAWNRRAAASIGQQKGE